MQNPTCVVFSKARLPHITTLRVLNWCLAGASQLSAVPTPQIPDYSGQMEIKLLPVRGEIRHLNKL